MPSKQ
ncbi:TPA_asm: UL27.6 uORF [Human alphaherpesvirus 1]